VKRINLYVAPEEYAEVRMLGAHWDAAAACWYVPAQLQPRRFERWLPGGGGENAGHEPFTIRSEDAYVAVGQSRCCRCRRPIEVVAIYCRSGTVACEPLECFTVQSMWAADAALTAQLQRWPWFRFDAACGAWANHCPRCRALQNEDALHGEPDQPFFAIAPAGSLRLTALAGTVQLSGDYSVEM